MIAGGPSLFISSDALRWLKLRIQPIFALKLRIRTVEFSLLWLSCWLIQGSEGESIHVHSKDGGTTWAQASTVGTRRFFQWHGVAMSSDGSKMAACGYGHPEGSIWTSMDAGVTWLQEATFDTDAYFYSGYDAWLEI